MGAQSSKQITRKRHSSVRAENARRSNVLVTKTTPFTNEYVVLEKRQLGVGVNGKVLLCQHKTTKKKYALKVNNIYNNNYYYYY